MGYTLACVAASSRKQTSTPLDENIEIAIKQDDPNLITVNGLLDQPSSFIYEAS